MPRKYYKRVFPSEIIKIKSIILHTVDFIRLNIFSAAESDLYDLRLIYSELLCNAVMHGNKGDSSKFVTLSVELDNDTVLSAISDEGCGFDYASLLAEKSPQKNIYSEHGRGILLARSLADSISFNGVGNEIVFSKKVNRNG